MVRSTVKLQNVKKMSWPGSVDSYLGPVARSLPWWTSLAVLIGSVVIASLNLSYVYKASSRTQSQLVFAWIWLASIVVLIFFKRFQTFEFVLIVGLTSLGFAIANVVDVTGSTNPSKTEEAYAYVWIATSTLSVILSPLAYMIRT